MTKRKNNNSILQIILIAIVIFAAAAGGMYFGSSFNNTAPNDASISNYESQAFSSLKLLPDSTFPNVELLDKQSHTIGSQSILNKQGTLILFIDSECPPCHDISLFWQKMINENRIVENQIVGISFNDYGYLVDFIENNNISFSVYTDPEFSFMQKYGIDAYPFALIVNSDSVITATFTDSDDIMHSDVIATLKID